MPSEDLPFFAYGAFMPGELAFAKIERYLDCDRSPEPADATGSLWVRDGLPLFVSGGRDVVRGALLRFKRGDSRDQAYGEIRGFEPAEIYQWCKIELKNPKEDAFVLEAKNIEKGNPEKLDESRWSFRLDPVFDEGLETIQKIVNELGGEPFSVIEWSRFFRLQMAYLLLWSAIERFSSFAYSPRLDPMERIMRMSKDSRFVVALQGNITESGRAVSDSRDPGVVYRLEPSVPLASVNYYYQVRSNLCHRGKGAWSDGETVRKSLIELLAIFKDMLKATERGQIGEGSFNGKSNEY
jgi:hypothetical protein